MRNRSNQELPAFYAYHCDMIAENYKPILAPLEINDFTYLHFHDCFEIGYCVGGKGICMVEDRQYNFQKGDVEIIFPFQKHLSRNKDQENSSWYWLTFQPYSLVERSGFSAGTLLEQLIFNEMGRCGIFTPEKHPEIVSLVERLFRELLNKDNDVPYCLEQCTLYLFQLFINLARISETLPKLKIEREGKLQAVSNALDIISLSVRDASKPSVEVLASACCMSVSNFRKVFQKVTGLSPKDYITKCFINKAQQLLLTTNKSIAQICMETGFGDISWFNRQFLAETQMTPSAFRKKYAIINNKH